MEDYLYHYGILKQKWGVRRFQNPDGSLTPAGRERYLKKDAKWAKKNYDKIYNKVYKKSRRELSDYVNNDLNRRQDIEKYNSDGSLSKAYINEYNRKMAEIMTKNASDIRTPNLGQVIKYINKRGEVGVHMIMSDQEYNMQELKNGVYSSGKIAYRKKQVNMA